YVGVGAEVVYPDRVGGSATAGAYEDVIAAVPDTHEGSLAGCAGFVAGIRDNDHRQAGFAQRRRFFAVRPLVALDLFADPVAGARYVFACHDDLRCRRDAAAGLDVRTRV